MLFRTMNLKGIFQIHSFFTTHSHRLERVHIKEALKLYHESIDMVVSVKETKANPYYILLRKMVMVT